MTENAEEPSSPEIIPANLQHLQYLAKPLEESLGGDQSARERGETEAVLEQVVDKYNGLRSQLGSDVLANTPEMEMVVNNEGKSAKYNEERLQAKKAIHEGKIKKLRERAGDKLLSDSKFSNEYRNLVIRSANAGAELERLKIQQALAAKEPSVGNDPEATRPHKAVEEDDSTPENIEQLVANVKGELQYGVWDWFQHGSVPSVKRGVGEKLEKVFRQISDPPKPKSDVAAAYLMLGGLVYPDDLSDPLVNKFNDFHGLAMKSKDYKGKRNLYVMTYDEGGNPALVIVAEKVAHDTHNRGGSGVLFKLVLSDVDTRDKLVGAIKESPLVLMDTLTKEVFEISLNPDQRSFSQEHGAKVDFIHIDDQSPIDFRG